MTNTVRVAIYARSATSPSPDSIAEQVQACHERAERSGWDICNVYTDEGISGASNTRPGLDALRASMGDGGVDTVLVEGRDRLFRDEDPLRDFVEMAKVHGVEVRSVFPDSRLEIQPQLDATTVRALLRARRH